MADIPPDLTPDGKLAWLTVQGLNSCLRCAYLYYQDSGWSNYTVEETEVICALGHNPRLPLSKPYDWSENPDDDNWHATQNGACAQLIVIDGYERAQLDVDGEMSAWNFNLPFEVQEAISGPK